VIRPVATWQRLASAVASRDSPRARPRHGSSTRFAGAGAALTRPARGAAVVSWVTADGAPKGAPAPVTVDHDRAAKVDHLYRAAEAPRPGCSNFRVLSSPATTYGLMSSDLRTYTPAGVRLFQYLGGSGNDPGGSNTQNPPTTQCNCATVGRTSNESREAVAIMCGILSIMFARRRTRQSWPARSPSSKSRVSQPIDLKPPNKGLQHDGAQRLASEGGR